MLLLAPRLLYYIAIAALFYVQLKRRGTRRSGQDRPNGGSVHGNRNDMANNGVWTTIEMVMDPVCNVAIARIDAVTMVVNGQEHYFCSRTCADSYQALNTQKAC